MKPYLTVLAPAVIVASLWTPLLADDSTRAPKNPSSDHYRSERTSSTPMFAKGTEIVGLEVRNNQDEKLGKVQDVVIDVASSRVVGLVVSIGGVLGVGGSEATVPMAAFRYDADRKALVTDLSADTLKGSPPFQTSGWKSAKEPGEVSELYRYYKVPAPHGWDRSPASEYGNPNRSEATANRGSDELTPVDQGNNDADLERTAAIRKAVMGHQTLSFTGKNVKIITINGRVTLRGSVPSESEREQIVKLAESVAPGQVTDQLQVDPKSTQP
ncbi:MAG: PRC-barrel domain-containing protein [Verrucomicrobia bacterium]|nr:PRC-barrel domain-containing protein [Verrucomicrobiota bacterium]